MSIRTRIILLCLILLIFSGTLFGAYLRFHPMELRQPDGSQPELFASGDEYYNWLHDKDGYTVKQNDNGWFVFLENDPTNRDNLLFTNLVAGIDNPETGGLTPWINISPERIGQIRMEFQTHLREIGAGRAPKTGILNNLVVFVRFSDQTEFGELITNYTTKFNGMSGNTMQNYFWEASYNQLDIPSTFYPTPTSYVVSWQDSNPRNYYSPYSSTNTIGYSNDTERRTREHTLLVNAVNGISSQVPTSLNLDGDNDGRVDNVVFIIKGATDAWATLLWPHRWALYTYTVNINGKRVYDYNFQLSNHMATSGVGVLCHEMFHSLGAPDLYRYTNTNISPVGTWDIMNSDTNPPQHMSAYMKYKYGGWISNIPTLSTGGTFTLNPLTSSTGQVFRINSPNTSSEYFVLEFRKKTGTFENSLPGSGIIIYRINPAYTGNAQGPPDEVYAFRPGGTPTANGTVSSANFSSETGRTAFNNTTNPYGFLTDGSLAGVSISNIGSSAGTTMSFYYNLENAPQNLTAESYNTKVFLTWQPTPSATPSGYKIYRNGSYLNTSTSLNYTDSNVTAGVSYSYYVRATFTNPTSESSPSNTVNITVSDTPILIIGTGTVTNQGLPIEPSVKYSYSQSIYLQSEMNMPVYSIDKISWYYNGNSAWTDDIVVYMGHTSASSFTSNSNWVPLANLTQVYIGSLTTTTTPGWIELTLTTPFIYDNTQNLVIAMDENTNSAHNSADEFYCTSVSGNRSLQYQSANTNPNPSSPPNGTLKTHIPNIRLTCSLNPAVSVNPTTLSFGNVFIGNTLTRSFSIANVGQGVLSGSITTPTGYAVSAAAREGEEELSDSRTSVRNTINFAANAGQSLSYNLVFTPTLAQSYNGNVVIASNDPVAPAFNLVVTGTGVTPVFNPPTSLTANPYHTAVYLSWTAPTGSSGTLTGYKVYRNGTLITPTQITTTNYTSTGLTNGTSYSFYVRAVYTNPTGESGNSNTVNAVPTPLPAQNLAGNPDNASVYLSWQAPQYGTPASYRVYRNGTLLGTATTLNYTDNSALNDVTYSYYVKAYYSSPTVESAASNTINATPYYNVTVTAAQGTTVDLGMPMEPYQYFSYTQSIYLQSEINQANKSIRKIRWHYNGNSSWTDAIQIYMGHTNLSAFPTNSSWVPVSNMTLVYDGTLTVPAVAGWVEITLNTEFAYNNTQNLVIAVDENTNGRHLANDEFYCVTKPTNRSITFASLATNPNPASPPTTGTNLLLRTAVPNLQLVMVENAAPAISVSPNSLSTTMIMGNVAALNLQVENTGTAPLNYSIQLTESGFAVPWVNVSPISGSIQAGQEQNIALNIYSQNTTSGVHNLILTINSNAVNQPSLQVPVQITVQLDAFQPQLTLNSQGISLVWNQIPGAVSYRIYKSNAPFDNYEVAATVFQNFYQVPISNDHSFYRVSAIME